MEKEILPVRSKIEAQMLAEFLLKEKDRHLEDINHIATDLVALKKKWGVTPRGRYVKKWIRP